MGVNTQVHRSQPLWDSTYSTICLTNIKIKAKTKGSEINMNVYKVVLGMLNYVFQLHTINTRERSHRCLASGPNLRFVWEGVRTHGAFMKACSW